MRKPKDIARDIEYVRKVDESGINIDDIYDDSIANINLKKRLLREKGIENLFVPKGQGKDGSTRLPLDDCSNVRINLAFRSNYDQSRKNIQNYQENQDYGVESILQKDSLKQDRSDVTLEQHLMALDGGWAWAKQQLSPSEFKKYLNEQYELFKESHGTK